MSRKSCGAIPNSTNIPPVGVDFLTRTMIERESTGKRQIRPKNVEDLFVAALGDESDDPDYEGADCSESNSDHSDDDDDTSRDSNDSDSEDKDTDEDTSTDSSNEDSTDDSDDDDSVSSPKEKKSALRETLQKLNETSFETKKSKKKRRKPFASNLKAKKGTNASSQSEGGTNVSKSSTKRPASNVPLNVKTKTPKLEKSSKKLSKERSKAKAKDKVKAKSFKRKKEKRYKSRKSKYSSISSLLDGVSANQKENRKEIDETRGPICSACLGDKSDEANEIVECDFCGITVHEGCYGIGDTLSVSSGSGSSCSTEPWFCDACKNGAEKIICDLCPTAGGLFKETSNGRWVHVVCALYTPGVGLGDPENLPNISSARYRWGSHTCSLCASERYATTGVVIQCDAGLCKTYLHASCAQRAGLLSDYTQMDSSNPEADPYYAACKLHTNREIAKRRAESFKVLQEQLRVRKEKKDSGLPPFQKDSQSRIAEKLVKIRHKNSYKRSKTQLPPIERFSSSTFLSSNLKDVQKKPRLMQTSTSIVDIFGNKADLMGENMKTLELEDRNERIVTNVKRKWNVLPAMSVEFAAYYNDRETRIASMSKLCEDLEQSNLVLNDQQIALKSAWDENCHNNQAMAENSDEIKSKIEELKTILQKLGTPNKKFLVTCNNLVKSSDTIGGSRRSPTRSSISSSLGKKKLMTLLTPPHLGRLSMLVKCDICHKSDGQHLITNCDQCKKNYHLACLDPPLTRLPKRTRLQGWVCSDCNDVDSQGDDDTKETQVDTDAPRTLRGRTNIKKPGKYRNSDESGEDEGRILSERLSNIEKKPVPANPVQTSPEVKCTVELPLPSTFINGSIRSSRRRSGGGNSVSNASITSRSRSLPTAKTGSVASSPVGDCISSKSPVVDAEIGSPNHAEKRRPNKRVKKLVIKNLANSKQVVAVKQKRKSSSTIVVEKPLVLTIKKNDDSSAKTDKSKQKFEVRDNVTAIIMENSLVKPTPIESSSLNNKNKNQTNSKKRKPSGLPVTHALVQDQKSVPLKKRRRISSTHGPLSEKSGLQNTNGPCNYKSNLIGSLNKNAIAENSVSLKIKQIPRPMDKAENFEEPVVANDSLLNSYASGLHSVNPPFSIQPNASPNHIALVDLSKNIKFNRDYGENDSISTLTATGPTTMNIQSQNHVQVPYNNDAPDSSGAFAQDTLNTALLSSAEGKCDTCGKEDMRKHLVTCDKCRLDFHFTCLDPPLKYSPKRRGYSWFCADCDETSSTDSKTENDVGVSFVN